jgi:sRNA-binding protein
MSEDATKTEAAISELAAAFPAAFTLDPTLVRPVKLGIRDDLYGRSALSHRRIAAALRAYCNGVQYLKASAEGAVRVDLAGEPAGTVTAGEAHHARDELVRLAKARDKGTSKNASSPGGPNIAKGVRVECTSRPLNSPTPKTSEKSNRVPTTAAATSGQKRLSLSDLKRAAAARKAK